RGECKNRGPIEGPRVAKEWTGEMGFGTGEWSTQRRLTAAAMAAERAALSAGRASVEITLPSAAMAEISDFAKSTMTRGLAELAGKLETEEMAPVSKSPEVSSALAMAAGAWTRRMWTELP